MNSIGCTFSVGILLVPILFKSLTMNPIRVVVTSIVTSLESKIANENQGRPIEMKIEKIIVIQLVLTDLSGKTFFGMDFGMMTVTKEILAKQL